MDLFFALSAYLITELLLRVIGSEPHLESDPAALSVPVADADQASDAIAESVAGGVAPGALGVEPPPLGGVPVGAVVGAAVGVGVGAATTLFSMFAEQMSSAPPPFTESLH